MFRNVNVGGKRELVVKEVGAEANSDFFLYLHGCIFNEWSVSF